MLDGVRDELARQLTRLLEEAERPMTVEEILPHLDPVMPTPNDVADVLESLRGPRGVKREGSYYSKSTPVPVDAVFKESPPRTREAARVVVELIRALDEETGEGAPWSALVQAAKARGIDRDRLLDIVTRLRLAGEAYSPRRDALRLSKP